MMSHCQPFFIVTGGTQPLPPPPLPPLAIYFIHFVSSQPRETWSPDFVVQSVGSRDFIPHLVDDQSAANITSQQ